MTKEGSPEAIARSTSARDRYVNKHFARHPLQALGLAAFLGLFRILPLDVASTLGGFLGRQIGRRLPVNRVAVTNLRLIIPDKTDSELAEIVKEMWDNIGRNVAEFPHLSQIVSTSRWRTPMKWRRSAATTSGPARRS